MSAIGAKTDYGESAALRDANYWFACYEAALRLGDEEAQEAYWIQYAQALREPILRPGA